MFKGQQQPNIYQKGITSGAPFRGINGARVGDTVWPTIVPPQTAQAPPKERQTVIDGFFEPIAGKYEHQQRFGQKSQYFNDDLMPSVDDQQMLKLCENDPETAHHNESLLQTVPTSPMSLARLNCEAQGLSRVQIVPLMRKTDDRLLHSKSYASNDPSKVYPGGVRFRSIQFSQTIDHVMNNSANDTKPISCKRRSKVALMEVVGALVSPMSYRDYCWDFVIRDPTAQDFARKHSTLPSPKSQPLNHIASDSITLQCRMYDIDKALDQSSLERDQILRIIGIVEQETFAHAGIMAYCMQCVGIRSASLDEIRFTTQGLYRGLFMASLNSNQ